MLIIKVKFMLIMLMTVGVASLKIATATRCLCGERGFSQFGQIFGTRVIGGKEAEVNEFPWAALLSIQVRGKKPLRCGGSLVNDR